MTTSTVAGTAATRRTRSRELNYRLDVVAFDVVDVVRSAGGWLFDRVLAGWEVNVLLAQPRDLRPLQILGVRTLAVESELEPAVTGVGLAVSANAFTADPRLRDKVFKALDRSLTEVTLWGQHWPLTVSRATTPVLHPLSGAARAFKRHALTAARISGPVGCTETLRSDLKTCLPVDSGFVPVGR